jgi:hypothetical protein
MRYREELDNITADHPVIFGEPIQGQRDYDAVGGTYREGAHVDAWGCVWSNLHEGFEAIVMGHPIATRESLHSYKPPAPGAGIPHGFMWLRLADLRGFEQIMVDFAEEPPELQELIDMVLQYNMGEVENNIRNSRDIAYFGDDLGTQFSLAISPKQWRKYIKPCYKAIYDKCHAAGLSVYMHSDGHLIPIVDDLIECGVNVLNPQIRANGLDRLVDSCKGKICVDMDLDRQMFPFCTPSDIDAHVREVVGKMGMPEGGLWLKAELGPEVPIENIKAMCVALEKYRKL